MNSFRFVDPMKMKPVRLSPAAVQALAPELQPTRASALVPLLKLPATPSAAELDALGIGHGTRESSKEGKFYRDALETLAKPELTFTLSEMTAATGALSFRVVLGLERAVLADIDTAGLSLSPPVPYSELVKRLTKHFENTTHAAQWKAFWPSELRVLTGLFSTEARLEATVSSAMVTERMEKAGVPVPDRKPALDELVKRGNLKMLDGGAYALTDEAAFWLKPMATGQMAELLAENHDASGKSAPAETQLRFVGPPGERVTMVTLVGSELKRLAGDNPTESAGVMCQVLDPIALAGLIEAFLGIGR